MSTPDDNEEEISEEAARLLAEYEAGKIDTIPWEEVKLRMAEAENMRLRRLVRLLALEFLIDDGVDEPTLSALNDLRQKLLNEGM